MEKSTKLCVNNFFCKTNFLISHDAHVVLCSRIHCFDSELVVGLFGFFYFKYVSPNLVRIISDLKKRL